MEIKQEFKDKRATIEKNIETTQQTISMLFRKKLKVERQIIKDLNIGIGQEFFHINFHEKKERESVYKVVSIEDDESVNELNINCVLMNKNHTQCLTKHITFYFLSYLAHLNDVETEEKLEKYRKRMNFTI
jgi:hypothetical protein